MPFFDELQAQTSRERQALFDTPQLVAGLAGEITRDIYLAYLGQAFHHVRHTTSLLTLARNRVDDRRRPYRDALDEYIREEAGHEEWVLDDIANAGGDAAAARRSPPGAPVAAMVDFVRSYVLRRNPMGMFGMVFVLEGASIALATQGASTLARSLELGPECFSYLTSHGALDQAHMAFFARLMNTVENPEDQAAIVEAAREVYRLFAAMFAAIPLGEANPAVAPQRTAALGLPL